MLLLLFLTHVAAADLSIDEVQYLNELPIEKLLQIKTSLQDLVVNYDSDNATTPAVYPSFGAQAMALNAPVKRTDYEGSVHKKESKLSHLFSMSITTLAFLAFGGYLLCLIVQAVKAKEAYNPVTQAPAFFLNAGIKKKPLISTQLSAYGRRRRALEGFLLPPEKMFDALLMLCEGYARWNQDKGHQILKTPKW